MIGREIDNEIKRKKRLETTVRKIERFRKQIEMFESFLVLPLCDEILVNKIEQLKKYLQFQENKRTAYIKRKEKQNTHQNVVLFNHAKNKPQKYSSYLKRIMEKKSKNPYRRGFVTFFKMWIKKVINRQQYRSLKKNKRIRGSVKMSKIGPKSYDEMTGLDGNDNDEELYILHKVSRRHAHRTSIDGMIQLLDCLFKGILPYEYDGKNVLITCIGFNEKRDNRGKIISKSNKKCSAKINILDIITRLQHISSKNSEIDMKTIQARYKIFINRLKRERYMKINNYVDCIFCIYNDDFYMEGIGRNLALNSFKSDKRFEKMSFGKVCKCLTCEKRWCTDCKVEFPPLSSDNSFSHNGLSCEDFINLKDKSDDDKSLFVVTNMKKCPKCASPSDKIYGCNKMTCGKCGCYWCYSCGSDISSEGYQHFRQDANDNTKCALEADAW